MIGAPSRSLVEKTIRRTVELGRVPAPSLGEARRAEVVAGWWSRDGLERVATDAVGNVRGRVREGDGPATLVCAHLDTVFDAAVDHTIVRGGNRLRGPGVGDDTVAVAALATLGALLPDEGTARTWIVATVGEEGLGNLTGIRYVLEHPPDRVGAVVAVEGNYLGRVCVTGVGAVRWRVTVAGPGGHAWEQAHAPSAIDAAARAIVRLADLDAPAGHASINVGRIGGGEAVNARARFTSFDVDIRADDPDLLACLVDAARDALDATSRDGVTTEVAELGFRPAGRIDRHHPLVRAAVEALAAIGRDPIYCAASTDANAAYPRDVPAITVGVTTGTGEHTPDEYIDLPPLGDGLQALARTVWSYQETRP